MPKKFQDYLSNKVTLLKWEDNGLLLANFIEFLCMVLIWHCYNKFRKLIAKYSNDLNGHKREYFPLSLWYFPHGNLNCYDDCLACFSYPAVSHFLTRNWWSENE